MGVLCERVEGGWYGCVAVDWKIADDDGEFRLDC